MDCGKLFAELWKTTKNKRHIDGFSGMKQVFMRLTKIRFCLLRKINFRSFPYGECCR